MREQMTMLIAQPQATIGVGLLASFGSVTAAIVMLLWLYNSAQIFVFGPL